MSQTMEQLHEAVMAATEEIQNGIKAISPDKGWHLMISFTGGERYGSDRSIHGDYTITFMGLDDKVTAAHPGNLIEEYARRKGWAKEQMDLAAPRLAHDVTKQSSAVLEEPPPGPPSTDLPF